MSSISSAEKAPRRSPTHHRTRRPLELLEEPPRPLVPREFAFALTRSPFQSRCRATCFIRRPVGDKPAARRLAPARSPDVHSLGAPSHLASFRPESHPRSPRSMTRTACSIVGLGLAAVSRSHRRCGAPLDERSQSCAEFLGRATSAGALTRALRRVAHGSLLRLMPLPSVPATSSTSASTPDAARRRPRHRTCRGVRDSSRSAGLGSATFKVMNRAAGAPAPGLRQLFQPRSRRSAAWRLHADRALLRCSTSPSGAARWRPLGPARTTHHPQPQRLTLSFDGHPRAVAPHHPRLLAAQSHRQRRWPDLRPPLPWD